MRLTLPLPPNIANARMHWRAKHRAKTDYWEKLTLLKLFGKHFPRPPTKPPERVSVSVTFYVWARMDEGNAFARLKWVEDWLVKNGYAVDDSPKHWRYTGIPEQIIDRKNPRIELVLAEEGPPG